MNQKKTENKSIAEMQFALEEFGRAKARIAKIDAIANKEPGSFKRELLRWQLLFKDATGKESKSKERHEA